MYELLKKLIDQVIYIISFFVIPIHHEKKKILILRKDGLGDCILFLPALAVLRKYYNNEQITLVFPGIAEGLAPLLMDMDNIIWFNHKKFSRNIFYRAKFLLGLKKAGYDIAIYPTVTREPIGDFMMKITRAKNIFGFSNSNDSIYSKVIKIPDSINLEIDRDMFLANEITGVKSHVEFPSIHIDKFSQSNYLEIVNKYSLSAKKYVIIFPGAGAEYRIWPHDRFASIIDYLVTQGIIPVFCGSKKEIPLVKRIFDSLNDNSRDISLNLTSITDISDLAHLLNNSLFYFGSDTGVAHLAVALNVPTIVIVGSGGLNRFFPYGDKLRHHIIFDDKNNFPKGTWEGQVMPKGNVHPSIMAISTESAFKEVDSMLAYINTKT